MSQRMNGLHRLNKVGSILDTISSLAYFINFS